jgi:hypothetical protein
MRARPLRLGHSAWPNAVIFVLVSYNFICEIFGTEAWTVVSNCLDQCHNQPRSASKVKFCSLYRALGTCAARTRFAKELSFVARSQLSFHWKCVRDYAEVVSDHHMYLNSV